MNDRKTYHTWQRNQILKFFEAHENECFCAKDIINNRTIAVGEATVYRYLAILSEEGKLKKYIASKDNGASYQYNHVQQCHSHFHLKCLLCGEMVHMDCSFMKSVEQHIEESHDFSIDNSKTILYGICKDCK